MDKYNLILDNTHCDLDMIWQILEIRREVPEAFYDRIQNLNMYFMFPYSIWSKSRTMRNYIPFENIESDTNRLEDNGCEIYFEFENVDVTRDCFLDRYSNLVLSLVQEKNVSAIVYSDELAQYIKEKYPNVKLVQSEIKRKTYFEAPFEMGVIDYISYKNNKNKLPNKPSCILAVNSFCKNSYRCTNLLSNNKLNYGIDRPINCADRLRTFSQMQKNDLFISKEEINKINDDGIQHFLIKTNCDDRFEILETYLYYMIKPEFIESARLRIIKACFTNR